MKHWSNGPSWKMVNSMCVFKRTHNFVAIRRFLFLGLDYYVNKQFKISICVCDASMENGAYPPHTLTHC